MPTTTDLLERFGGEPGIGALVGAWYPRVLVDPLLQPLFGLGDPHHIDHLTAFLTEVFGGATRYTDDLGGFPTLLTSHRGLAITEEQRARFIALFLAAFDEVGPPDSELRRELAAYLDFGTEVAVVNSHAATDGELHPCQEVPRWP
jgi:hemoglobin